MLRTDEVAPLLVYGQIIELILRITTHELEECVGFDYSIAIPINS